MPKRIKRSIKANKGRGFFRPGSGELSLKIRYDLLQSAAYVTLPFSAQLVVIDWIRFYYEKSHWETIDIEDLGGFEYCFAVCNVLRLSENSFLRARKQIVQHGFFSTPPEIQTHEPCSATVFVPSSAWEKYKPTAAEKAALQRWQRSRQTRLERSKSNRKKALTALEAFRELKQAPKTVADLSMNNVDKQGQEKGLQPPKSVDMQTPVQHPN